MLKHNIKQQQEAKLNFIPKAQKVHGETYDYSKSNYINANTKILIICPKHGEFYQIPRMHTRKNKPTGCPKCKGGVLYSKKEFVEKAHKVHNNKYDYNHSNYVNHNTKIDIMCPNHGLFKQQPNNHLFGQGCPVCNSSKGEIKISNFLKSKNIPYVQQKTFKNCRGIKRPLPFDFYIPTLNICIEFQGEQHYRPAFGKESFKKIQVTDNIKELYCVNNNITLIKINYNEIDNIDTILTIKMLR